MTFQFIMTGTNHESYGKVKDYIKEAKKLGIKSIATVDRNSVGSSIQFIKECKNNNIKPIIGITNSLDYPLLDNLNFIEKNKEIFKFLINNMSLNVSNHEELIKLSENTISKFKDIFNELNKSYEFFNRSKSKDKNNVLFEKITESLKNLELFEEEKNQNNIDKDVFINGFINVFKNLDNNNYFRDIKILGLNESGIIRLNELITHAYKTGQSKLDLETTSKKRKPNSHPLINIEELSNNYKGILCVLNNTDNDLFFEIENPLIKDRILQDLKKRIGDNLIISVNNNAKDDTIHKIKEKNSIVEFLKYANKYEIPIMASHLAKMPSKEDFEVATLKSLQQEGIISYLPKKPERIKSFEYLISDSEFENNFANLPSTLLENNKDIESLINTKMLLGKNYLPVSPIPEDFTRKIYSQRFSDYNLVYDDKKTVQELSQELKHKIYEKLKDKYQDKELNLEVGKELSNILSNPYLEHIAWQGTLFNLKKDFPENWEQKLPEYKERFDFEFDIISKMGFSGYFLIVYDIIKYAKENDIGVGPGRGSGAASLIAYALKITNLDPIETDLFFERFLNPERVSMPDFDIDIASNGRDKLINYIKKTYSEEMVSQIGTIGVFKPKSSFAALIDVLGYTVDRSKAVSKYIPEDPSLKLEDLTENEDFISHISKEPVLEYLFEKASSIENEVNNYGIHAGGIVIAANTNLTDFSPIVCSPDGSGAATQFDKNDAEEVGLVKFDFLGLSTLDVIDYSLKQIQSNYGFKIDIDSISITDQKTFELLKTAKTQNIFQLSSDGMKKLVKELQVDTLEDISALVALYRPGPMQSGMMESFVQRRTGKEPIKYIHKNAKEITNNTYGTVVYQEQVMKIAEDVAGYTKGEGDMLRRAMGKKKPEEMLKYKGKFIGGGQLVNFKDREKEIFEKTGLSLNLKMENINFVSEYINENGFISDENKYKDFLLTKIGIKEDIYKSLIEKANHNDIEIDNLVQEYKKEIFLKISEKMEKEYNKSFEDIKNEASVVYFNVMEYIRYLQVFNVIEKFAGYGFNKAHSLAYALVSYQTAYLKANYTKEFFAGVLTQESDVEKLHSTVSDMENNFNIKLQPPSVNESDFIYLAKKDEQVVISGLKNIKSVGVYGLLIEKERKINGNFKDLPDLLLRVAYRNELEKEANNSKLPLGAFKGLLYSGALDCFIENNFRYREFLNLEYANFNYPENITEFVESYILNDKRKEQNEIYLGEGNFNLFQNLLVKTVANTKLFSNLFFSEEEVASYKKNTEEHDSKMLSFFNFIKNRTINTVDFDLIGFNDFPNNEELKEIENCKKEQKNNLLQELINSRIVYSISQYIPEKSAKEYVNILTKKPREKLTAKDKKTILNIEEELNNHKSFIDNIIILNNKLNYSYDKSNPLDVLEIMMNANNHFINNSLPLGVYKIENKFNLEKLEPREKVLFLINSLKENQPKILERLKDNIKKYIISDDFKLLKEEKSYTGLYMSMHPIDIDNAETNYKSSKKYTITIKELEEIAENQEKIKDLIDKSINIICAFEEVNEIKTKKGKDMARILISDKTGSLNVTAWSEMYSLIKEHINGNNVAGVEIKISLDKRNQQENNNSENIEDNNSIKLNYVLNSVRFFNPNIIKEISSNGYEALKNN